MTALICNKPIASVYKNLNEHQLGEALLGQLFVKIGENEKYYKVKVWGVEGWINKGNADETVINIDLFDRTINSLNTTVYETADFYSKHLSMLYCGTKVRLIEKKDQWLKVEAYGLSGWILDFNVRTIKPVQLAATFIDSRNLLGGNSESGIDCLGLVHLFLTLQGIDVPRSREELEKGGVSIQSADIKEGDIVFFPDSLGIYEGNERCITVRDLVKHYPLYRYAPSLSFRRYT